MKRFTTLAFGLVLLLLAAPAFGQGVLIIIDSPHPTPLPRPWPRPTPTTSAVSYKIKELAYQAKVTDQIAQVQVSQTFENTGSSRFRLSSVFRSPMTERSTR